MTPDVLRHVFEPFFTTKGGQGTGLGLSQVYGFATQSGGGVTLRSDPQSGTTVTILLPRADGAPAAAPDGIAPTVQTPRGKQGESILVVEDDDDVRAFTVGSLRDLGYTVFEAADAASALTIVAREPTIGLLFTDLGLPGGVDGKALSEQARVLRPSLGVLITTAYAAAALIHDGRLDQGIDVLVKPFTVEALAARIREMMDQPRGEPDEIRILVVEDEMLVRLYLVQTLTELGCQVEEAANAGEALSIFAARGDRFTMAMVDLGLPDRPGDEVVKEMRRARPDLPVVLATGHADATVRQRLAGLPAVQVLQKPFHRADIEAMFSRLGIDIPVP
jgi:CheY-like chemotaxis protein